MLVNLLAEAVIQTAGVLTLACGAFAIPLEIRLGAAKQQQLHLSRSSAALLAGSVLAARPWCPYSDVLPSRCNLL